MASISFYGSHNAALALEMDGKVELVLETERFINYKNGAIAQYKLVNNPFLALECMVEWIRKKYNIDEFEKCYTLNDDVTYGTTRYLMHQLIPAKEYFTYKHHVAHAAGAFYQSSHENALIFSFDGGGDDGKFNIFFANRRDGLTLLESVTNPLYKHPHMSYDLGFPYMLIGHYLEDIKQENLSDGNLVYPGKLMGLASYGRVNYNWLPFFIAMYKSNPNGNNYEQHIKILSMNLGINLDEKSRLSGQTAWDLAATSQKAFEECFLEIAIPYLKKYPELPVGITGGCGLNIILNTRLVNEFERDVFVGPNPNDCGIAVGGLLSFLKPEQPADITYAGTPLLDIDTLGMYTQTHSARKLVNEVMNPFKEVSFDELVTDLIDGKIIGVARGRSEHGPRALGNRSIICNPMITDMKDILNAKVKYRESYRPFAPVVRLEDVNTYFEWETESRWMTFCPVVRSEWREKLTAITHVDNTARVQTVTKQQNEWLYNLLTLFAEKAGVGILLNTSFNVNGKPILSTLSDAFEIFNKTQLDGLIIENYYFRKNGYVT